MNLFLGQFIIKSLIFLISLKLIAYLLICSLYVTTNILELAIRLRSLNFDKKYNLKTSSLD